MSTRELSGLYVVGFTTNGWKTDATQTAGVLVDLHLTSEHEARRATPATAFPVVGVSRGFTGTSTFQQGRLLRRSRGS